jgi:hypothetical protein
MSDASATADPIYLIMAGVRRSVAARELGLTTFRAVVDVGGALGPVFEVPLASLYSTKDRISRSAENDRYLKVERAIADPLVRPLVPELIVTRLSEKRIKYFTALKDVVLEP